MDRERFGRALGFGAREAGKALLKAADAATTPSPPRPRPTRSQPTVINPTNLKRGTKRFGEAMWGPVARASGVLWFELTGVFFSLFALTSGLWLARNYRDFAHPGPPRQHILFALAMLLLFGWFTASSFLQAAKRSRRR